MLNSRARFDVKAVIRSMGVLVGVLALTPFSEAQVPPPPWEQTPSSDPYYWREYNFVNPDNFTQESGGGQRDRPVRPIIFDIQRPPGTNSPDGTRPRATREGEPNNIPSQRFGITEGADGDDPVDVQWWVILQIPDQADTNLSKVLWFAYDFRGSGGELTASGGPGMFPNNERSPTFPPDRQSANHAEGYIEFSSKPSTEWLRLDFYVPAGGSNHFTIDNLQVGTVCVPEPPSAIPLFLAAIGSLCFKRRARRDIRTYWPRSAGLFVCAIFVAGAALAQAPPPPWERTPESDPYYWREYSFTNPDNHTQESGGGQRDRPVQPIIWTIAPKPGTNPPESTRPRGTRQGEPNNVPSQRFGIPAGDPQLDASWQVILQIPDRAAPNLNKFLWFSFDYTNSARSDVFIIPVFAVSAGSGQFPTGQTGNPTLPPDRNRERFDNQGRRIGGHIEGYWEFRPKPETEWFRMEFNLLPGTNEYVAIDNLRIGTISVVPEPSSFIPLLMGIVGSLSCRRRLRSIIKAGATRAMMLWIAMMLVAGMASAQPPPPWERTPSSDPYYWREYSFTNPDNHTQESGGGQRDRPVRPIVWTIAPKPGTNPPESTRPRGTRQGEPNNVPSQRFGIPAGDPNVAVDWQLILQIPDRADPSLNKILWFSFDFANSGEAGFFALDVPTAGAGQYPNGGVGHPSLPDNRNRFRFDGDGNRVGGHYEGFWELQPKPETEWILINFSLPAGAHNFVTIDNLKIGAISIVPEPMAIVGLCVGLAGLMRRSGRWLKGSALTTSTAQSS